MITRPLSRGIPGWVLFAAISIAGVELRAAPQPEKFRQARDLEGRNEISKAVSAYRIGISAKPSNSDEADACVQLGLLLLRQGQSGEAAKEFRKVLDAPSQVIGRRSPVVKRARRGMFFALLDGGKYDEADRFIEEQIKADGRPGEIVEKALAERKKEISRYKAEAPLRKAIRKTINEFLHAIVARDFHALKATLSSRFPQKQEADLERQLPSSKISSMEPEIVDIQFAGAEAKATAVVSAAESKGEARPRSFFFKMVLEGDQWKIGGY